MQTSRGGCGTDGVAHVYCKHTTNPNHIMILGESDQGRIWSGRSLTYYLYSQGCEDDPSLCTLPFERKVRFGVYFPA